MFSFKSVGVAATACAAGTVCAIASGLAYYKRKTAALATERAAAGKVGLAGLLIEAGIFIAEKHTDQHAPTRTHESIVNHYLRVADILNTHSVHDPAVLQASILLGTMTDARTTFRELCAKFGPKVAVIVQALTVDGHVPVYGRPQRLFARADGLSRESRLVLLAHQLVVVSDVLEETPKGWDGLRAGNYCRMAERVVGKVAGTHAGMEKELSDVFKKVQRKFPFKVMAVPVRERALAAAA